MLPHLFIYTMVAVPLSDVLRVETETVTKYSIRKGTPYDEVNVIGYYLGNHKCKFDVYWDAEKLGLNVYGPNEEEEFTHIGIILDELDPDPSLDVKRHSYNVDPERIAQASEDLKRKLEALGVKNINPELVVGVTYNP